MGIVLWHQIEFPDIDLRLSNDVWRGDVITDPVITVKYEIGTAATVKIVLKDLPVPTQEKIATALNGKGKDGLKVIVRLGYLDEPWNQDDVFAGRIESFEGAGRNLPTSVLLTGTEEAAFALQATSTVDEVADQEGSAKQAFLSVAKDANAKDALQRILDAVKKGSGVTIAMPKEVGTVPDPAAPPWKELQLFGGNAFVLLTKLAERFNAEAILQDGKVLLGSNLKYPPDAGPLPKPPNLASVLAAIVQGNDLIVLNSDKGTVSTQLSDFKPFQLSASKQKASFERPAVDQVGGFDFVAAGRPELRAGQLLIANFTGYDKALAPFRILSLTHTYSSEATGGFTSAGRAVQFIESGKSNRPQSELARKAGPLSVADKIAGKAAAAASGGSAATDVGRISGSKPAEHRVTVQYGQQASSFTNTPSVDLDIPQKKDGPKLADKPVVSPFAWHKTGLSTPTYVGMRAVLNQVRGSRDDTVVTGYLWSNEPKLEPPPAKDGDWWLSLPTEVSGDPPMPKGKGANDLTAADGRRVIEATGLKIAVGKDALTDVGTRPTEGTADVLLISHKSGTTVEVDADGNVTVDGKKKVVLKAGGVTLTVGDGKVAIS